MAAKARSTSSAPAISNRGSVRRIGGTARRRFFTLKMPLSISRICAAAIHREKAAHFYRVQDRQETEQQGCFREMGLVGGTGFEPVTPAV
jgi:hypothetical protein